MPANTDSNSVVDSDSSLNSAEPTSQKPVPVLDAAPKFQIGRILATPAAIAFAKERGIDLLDVVRRHCKCDPGDLCPEDVQVNNDAIASGGRVFSSYRFDSQQPQRSGYRDPGSDERLWVITEADRASTTVLLPSDY
jgi:hypothetical protein